jgi:hypothetical protein
MRKTLLVLLAIALAGFAGQASAVSNLGSTAEPVFEGHVLTPDAGGPRVLYAPSESDDAAYRAAIAAQVGGTCDYFDARYATPSASQLAAYDCAMTWANYGYFDNVGFGNNLADFVDAGGHVILGAFAAYTSGNYLRGRVMEDPAYCPVTGGSNHFSLSFWDGTDATCCVHVGITSYGTTYRDYLTLRSGVGAYICGRYQDGEIANALNAAGAVVYANGAGGYPLFPSGQDAARAGNGCLCGEPTAATPSTWGAVKDLYQ